MTSGEALQGSSTRTLLLVAQDMLPYRLAGCLTHPSSPMPHTSCSWWFAWCLLGNSERMEEELWESSMPADHAKVKM